jgi:hypothetical protein
VSIQFQEYRCQIGAFQEITRTFGIPPKIVSLQEYLSHLDHMGPNHKSKGHKGRSAGPTPWLASHPLSRFWPRLDGYAPKSIYNSIPCSEVGGDREEWSASHVDGHPVIHQLQTDSIKSVEAPIDLYIRILMIEFRTHHTILVVLHMQRFRFSSRSTGEALSGVQSRVESLLELRK